jgi:hypothetical protein
MRYLTIFCVIATLSMGCSEEALDSLEKRSDFSSFEDLYLNSSKYRFASKNELNNLANQLGYKSFGQKQDEVYENLLKMIENKEITSEDEVQGYIDKNNEFLRVSTEESGEKTVDLQFDQGYRYFMTLDRQITIGSNQYRVYVNGILGSGSAARRDEAGLPVWYENVDDPSFNERDLVIYSDNNRLGANDPNNECGQQKSGQTTNGDNRTKVYAITERQSSGNTYYMGAAFQAKAFNKTLGFWFSVKRTLKGAYAIGMDYQTLAGWYSSSGSNYYPPFKAKIIGEEAFATVVVSWSGSGKPDYHLNGVYVWADSPSTSYANKECNDDYICILHYCYPPVG